MLTPLGLSPSFGFGDRLGLATPGHIAAIRGTGFSPIFAQQSVRENARLRRTPQQVMDDAKRAVEIAGWDCPWGADADHLKSIDDIMPFVKAGYTFFTVDPGEYVDNTADADSTAVLKLKAKSQNWDRLSALYLNQYLGKGFGEFDTHSLLRAAVKYGGAIQFTIRMYQRLSQLVEAFDFEISVDETEAPTSPLEHFFIASELTRLKVRFTSFAPRFIGRFEKGVDYIGDLNELDTELTKHAAVAGMFGTYKLSLHSGSDKFSVYPLIVKHWGNHLHVKTAGTSYLEGLRTLAIEEPALFMRIWTFGIERYPIDRDSYQVSADIRKVPTDVDLPDLLDDFHAREILHVTFGSVITRFRSEIRLALEKYRDLYYFNLYKHFCKHFDALK